MGVTHHQVQLGTSGRGFVAHADQVELLLEALGHTDHHVVHQLTHGATHGICFTGCIGRSKVEFACVVSHGHQGVECQLQGATSAFDTDNTCIEGHIHTGGDRDWKFAYTGHL